MTLHMENRAAVVREITRRTAFDSHLFHIGILLGSRSCVIQRVGMEIWRAHNRLARCWFAFVIFPQHLTAGTAVLIMDGSTYYEIWVAI